MHPQMRYLCPHRFTEPLPHEESWADGCVPANARSGFMSVHTRRIAANPYAATGAPSTREATHLRVHSHPRMHP